jgi:MFS family permease
MRMTPLERSAAGWLASIFALRMLGLFMILPVLAVHARGMPGGSDLTMVGLALGIYGLTQACLQIPMGWASDKLGRKPVIVAGLVVFAAGSLWAAYAPSLEQLVFARALQGAGAISAAVTAFLADLTRDEVRSKAMAMIGGSIGLTFAVSLAGAPALYSAVGMSGLFLLTAGLCVCAIWVVINRLPADLSSEVKQALANQQKKPVPWQQVVFQPDLLRLNVGIFTLHLTQMAMFVVIPGLLLSTGALPVEQHWKVYLPVVLLSFVLMIPPMIWAEKKGKTKTVKLLSVAAMAAVQALFAFATQQFWLLVGLLVIYFVSFNLLEAMLPSWVSRVAPPQSKGLALGVYNTTQALGLFLGGWLGGWVSKHSGSEQVFIAISVLTLVWLVVILKLTPLPKRVKAADMSVQTAAV